MNVKLSWKSWVWIITLVPLFLLVLVLFLTKQYGAAWFAIAFLTVIGLTALGVWVAAIQQKSKRSMSAAEAAHMVSHGPILSGGRRERD